MIKYILAAVLTFFASGAQAAVAVVSYDTSTDSPWEWGTITNIHTTNTTIPELVAAWNAQFGELYFTVEPNNVTDVHGLADSNFSVNFIDVSNDRTNIHLHTYASLDPNETNPVHTLPGVDMSPVPLPPAVWLFGTGLIGLVGIARRRVILKQL